MDYTNLYEFQTGNGVIVPTDSDVLQGIQEKFQEIFGSEIDLSAETPVGRLIESMSIIVKSTLGVTAQCANQFNLNEATGSFLDSLGEIYNIKRIPGTNTRVVIRCYFSTEYSGDIEIPAGSLISAGESGELFRTDSVISSADSQTEPDTGRLFTIGTATSVDVGHIVVEADTSASISTGTPGWIGVSVDSVAYMGTDVETDEEFRERMQRSRATGSGFQMSLISMLNRLIGVYSSCILDNNTGDSMTTKGVVIPPHSIFVGIDFIETDDLKEEIARVISQNKPLGTGMVNEETGYGKLFTIPVKYGYGNDFTHEVNFYQAVRTPILVSVNYSYGKYTGLNLKKDIASVISKYMDQVGVGGQVDGMRIAAELSINLNIGVGQIMVQKRGSNIPYDIKIDMLGYETPFSAEEYITFVEE